MSSIDAHSGIIVKEAIGYILVANALGIRELITLTIIHTTTIIMTTTRVTDQPYALLGDILLRCDTCDDIGHALYGSKHFSRAMDRSVVAGIRAKKIHEKMQAERAAQHARWTAWKHRKATYMLACLEELLRDHTPAFLFSDPDGIVLAYQDQTRAELTFDICDPEPPRPS